MDLFTREDLQVLVQSEVDPCVSVLMPTARAMPEKRQNQVRFRKLVREAEEGLVTAGLNASQAKEAVAPARELAENALIWRNVGDGMAAFIAPGFFHHYHLPLALAERVVIGHPFHVKPLLPLLTYDGEFHVLALSKKESRLLRCSRQTHIRCQPEEMPKSLAEILQYDVWEKHLDFHTRAPKRGDRREAIFHGDEAGSDVRKDRVSDYINAVEKGVHEHLGEKRTPLVLAGVAYLQGAYRKVASYPALAERGITGNPDKVSDEELHRRGWEVVRPLLEDEPYRQAVERHGALIPDGRSVSAVAEVVKAALQGLLDTLFVDVDDRRWGRVNMSTGAVEELLAEHPHADELTTFAAVHALGHGARVHPVNRERVPGGGPLAGVLRYAMASSVAS